MWYGHSRTGRTGRTSSFVLVTLFLVIITCLLNSVKEYNGDKQYIYIFSSGLTNNYYD